MGPERGLIVFLPCSKTLKNLSLTELVYAVHTFEGLDGPGAGLDDDIDILLYLESILSKPSMEGPRETGRVTKQLDSSVLVKLLSRSTGRARELETKAFMVMMGLNLLKKENVLWFDGGGSVNVVRETGFGSCSRAICRDKNG